MRRQKKERRRTRSRNQHGFFVILGVSGFFIASLLIGYAYAKPHRVEYIAGGALTDIAEAVGGYVKPEPVLDKKDYDRRMNILANNPPPPPPPPAEEESAETDGESSSTSEEPTEARVEPEPLLWPVEAVYPNVGAILPFSRIVAYYGNFYSKGMGVLGEYPRDIMLDKLRTQVKEWELADPNTPVVPAIDYIAVTAQGSPGEDGDYNLRMPDDQIDYALELAAEVDGVVVLEVQVGLSNLQKEIKLLEPYLKKPNVHLAIDPEFSMKRGNPPGTWIGTVDASDINTATSYLAELVRDNHLPPKILVVHRFTPDMVTNYKNIKPLPEVQIVIDMDGWGSPEKKRNTYSRVIYSEPVQFTGFKVFYGNDLKPPSSGLMTPEEILNLRPRPIFIQYQ